MATSDDEFRFLKNALRFLGDDVDSALASRGWAVTDLAVADDQSLEWFWPPTAPVGYGGLPEWSDDIAKARPQMFGHRQTPWLAPTRIVKAAHVWRVDFGEAVAQKPDQSLEFASNAALLSDLERIEWWPMTIAEAREIQGQRLLATTIAAVHDDHFRAVFATEPYAGRINAIRAHMRYEYERSLDRTKSTPPNAPRLRGDLGAQMRLVDAESWASAVRTARAGGTGWDVDGPVGDTV
ncbi:hypothetical protein ITJ38_09645 [Agreia pratensis]|uniref:hypothetical protein n=1 Tax=Agreia pratensis TaxID=150121 RepID=UPI001889C416|nr:hypothetical protein [Agreia pratensis]MBF4634663.1 hypothetical protein [Agreia pratensis]